MHILKHTTITTMTPKAIALAERNSHMTYSAQDLFDYSVENEAPLDTFEVMEAMAAYPMNIMDAFDYAVLKGMYSVEDIHTIIESNSAGSI